jgi:hypothetical protein
MGASSTTTVIPQYTGEDSIKNPLRCIQQCGDFFPKSRQGLINACQQGKFIEAITEMG